eukprot:COSAG06_NODE_53554_length_299_cov_1.030000_1_plen_31_part_01
MLLVALTWYRVFTLTTCCEEENAAELEVDVD